MSERQAIPRDIRAEAAAWLARMRSDSREPEDEAGFRRWLADDNRHADAFDQVTAIWDAVGGVGAHVGEPAPRAEPRVSLRLLVVAGLAALAIPATGLWYLRLPDSYVTGVGEQRRVVLADNSSVMLDTDTEILVTLSTEKRSVELVRGRAHFAVTKDRLRPFQVSAADQQVAALGTIFDVERVDGAVSVVLVEGKVAVRPVRRPLARSVIMAPGERLRWDAEARPVVDRPDLVAISAWQSGRAMFNDTPLSEAVAEMNRYTRRSVIIADPALASKRISGAYATADPEAFARSTATLLSASVAIGPTRIIVQ